MEKRKASNKITDHIGHTFKNAVEMCQYWGINYHLFKNRYYRLGYSIREALTCSKGAVLTNKNKKKCTDHLGQEYESISQMCEHYGISINLYIHRMGLENWSLKDVLTTPADKHRRKLVKDHLGNKFINIKEMCKYWNVNYYTFLNRKHRSKYTLKDCLTKKTGEITDHLGNKYKSIKQLAQTYNLSYSVLKARLNKHAFNGDLKKILLTPKLEPKETEQYKKIKSSLKMIFAK